MQADRRRIATVSPTNRSAVSNGTRLLQGVDGRSSTARRFRDLVRAFEVEIGGALSEVNLGLIKQAAALTLQAEQLQADIVNGKDVDGDHLIRLTGTSNRILSGLKKRSKLRPTAKPTLQDHLAARRSTAAGAQAD